MVAYALPHLFASLMATELMYGKYRWPLFSELYESVQSIFLITPVCNVIANPHKPTFMVTPKGVHLDHDFLSPLAKPYYLMFVVMLVAIPVAGYRWFTEPNLRDVLTLCIAWLSINIVIALASLGAFWERHQIRHFHRIWAKGQIGVSLPDQPQQWLAELTDLSLSGVGFTTTGQTNLQLQQKLTIYVTDSYGQQYQLPATIKRVQNRQQGQVLGCVFDDVKQHYAELIAVVYGDSRRWLDFWQRPSQHPSTSQILWYFIKMGYVGAKQSRTGLKALFIDYQHKIRSAIHTLVRS